jgi:hypothetical protein
MTSMPRFGGAFCASTARSADRGDVVPRANDRLPPFLGQLGLEIRLGRVSGVHRPVMERPSCGAEVGTLALPARSGSPLSAAAASAFDP